MKQRSRVLIVGAGPAGLVVAALLAKADHEVTVIEKRGDPAASAIQDKRSVNFTISPRGQKSLEAIGAWAPLEPLCVSIIGRCVHGLSEADYQVYSPESPAVTTLYSIRRTEFMSTLSDHVRSSSSIELHYDTEFVTYEFSSTEAVVKTASGIHRQLKADFIVGADGASSRVAELIRQRTGSNIQRKCFSRVYKKFEISVEQASRLNLCRDFVHFFRANDDLVLALANRDGTFSGNLFFKRDRYKSANDWLRSTFESDRYSSRCKHLIEVLYEQFEKFPESHVYSHVAEKWHFSDRLVLVGDAAHTVYHFYAQGLNASLEDARVFVETVAQQSDRLIAFQDYQRARLLNALALESMSEEHYFVLEKLTLEKSYSWRMLKESVFTWLKSGRPNTYEMVVRPEYSYSDAHREIGLQRSIWRLLICKIQLSFRNIIGWQGDPKEKPFPVVDQSCLSKVPRRRPQAPDRERKIV